MGLSVRSGPDKLSDREKALEILRVPEQLPTRDDVRKGLRSFITEQYTADDSIAFIDQSDFERIHKRGDAQEILTKEFITALANHITSRPAPDHETVVLEVGAGNGRLSHFLSEALNEKAPGKFKVIATSKSDAQWNIEPLFEVENLGYKEALAKYSPDIVISSWMPYGQDWTADMRKVNNVKEYLLIGEPEATGSWTDTWSDSAHKGFTSEEVGDACKAQIGRINENVTVRPLTYAFRRQEGI